MGFFSLLAELFRPYNDDDELLDYEAPVMRDESSLFTNKKKQAATTYKGGLDEQARSGKIYSINATAQLNVALVKPEKFEYAAEIANHLRNRDTVVMNLERADSKIARRLIDFLSGVAYAQDGKVKKIAINTYLITPFNVDLIGDVLDELGDDSFFF